MVQKNSHVNNTFYARSSCIAILTFVWVV